MLKAHAALIGCGVYVFLVMASHITRGILNSTPDFQNKLDAFEKTMGSMISGKPEDLDKSIKDAMGGKGYTVGMDRTWGEIDDVLYRSILPLILVVLGFIAVCSVYASVQRR